MVIFAIQPYMNIYRRDSGDYMVTVPGSRTTLTRQQAIELYRALLRDLIRTEPP